MDKGSLTYGEDYGKTLWIPVWSAAIFGADVKIVVDTGFLDAAWVQNTLGIPSRCSDDEGIEHALQHIGWKPEEVDIVINTHLHYDHMRGNMVFPKAHFVVQEREWYYALQPVKPQLEPYSDLVKGIDFFRWHFVSGIKYMPLPHP